MVNNRWHFFNGALQTWEVSSDGDSFTSGQLFKAGSPHSGVGRKSTATPPYHRHTYQTETFHVVSLTQWVSHASPSSWLT